jgi:hypothetical protein
MTFMACATMRASAVIMVSECAELHPPSCHQNCGFVLMKCWRYVICLALVPALSSCGAACLSTPLAEVHGPPGITFKVTRTDCDTLAKDSAVSVITTRDGDKASALLASEVRPMGSRAAAGTRRRRRNNIHTPCQSLVNSGAASDLGVVQGEARD